MSRVFNIIACFLIILLIFYHIKFLKESFRIFISIQLYFANCSSELHKGHCVSWIKLNFHCSHNFVWYPIWPVITLLLVNPIHSTSVWNSRFILAIATFFTFLLVQPRFNHLRTLKFTHHKMPIFYANLPP